MEKRTNPMNMETKISIKFRSELPPTPTEQMNLDALNRAAEEVANTLQPVFQRLAIEMLDLKRKAITLEVQAQQTAMNKAMGGHDARS